MASRPKRVTNFVLMPPIAGSEWQAAQETSLSQAEAALSCIFVLEFFSPSKNAQLFGSESGSGLPGGVGCRRQPTVATFLRAARHPVWIGPPVEARVGMRGHVVQRRR
jgi:hypothetical protein